MHKWYRTIIGFVAGISAVPALGADAKSGQLEEIVVTATRHEESLSKVPISVTAMTQESLDVKGIKVLAAAMDGADGKGLREAMDKLKDKLKSAAIVLAATEGSKVTLIAGVTADLTEIGRAHV